MYTRNELKKFFVKEKGKKKALGYKSYWKMIKLRSS